MTFILVAKSLKDAPVIIWDPSEQIGYIHSIVIVYP